MSETVVEKMSRHFAPPDLRQRVQGVLDKAGKRPGNTQVEELAGLDQWHVEGLVSTRRLAETAAITANDVVLDAGCGMGGPARYLANTYGCTVRGLDMTIPYLETAQLLNDFTGLSDTVLLERGDVTDMRFDDGSFDVVWTQHAAQSIPDKPKFFAEMYRVLKPGGRLVIHDLYRGPGDPIHFPAFWGEDDSISFLVSDREMRELLETTGFQVRHWNDTTQAAHAANSAMDEDHAKSELQSETIDGLDIFLLFDQQTLVMAENSVKDMEVGSIGIFEAVLDRP
ncbi:MAG TPA: methyltransferase domain-containing protein [Solirubrobacteraceae bacterium]|nr:methyltransferase domain-containing protein [Solirubrobacteraceae bacterium]